MSAGSHRVPAIASTPDEELLYGLLKELAAHLSQALADTAMSGPEPSTRAAIDPRTVRLELQLLERTAGRRRRCRDVIAGNARTRGQAWSVCTPCSQAIEDETRQLETAPAVTRRRLVCRTDIVHLRAGARTGGDAYGNVLSRLLCSQHRPVS